MSWTNAYKPPTISNTEEDLYGGPKDVPYDLNFCFPVLPTEHCAQTLTNPESHVRLTPFIPRVHGAPLYTACAANPELFDWLPIALPPSLEAFLVTLTSIFQRDPSNLLFVVMVPKPKVAAKDSSNAKKEEEGEEEGWQIAGTMGLIHASPQQLSTELALALTLTPFQRTHVTSNAIGLALRYCLNLPTDAHLPGLGLRRVQWQANPLNVASVRAAERMGFRKEGVHRWVWPLPAGRSGHEPRVGDPMKESKGRDSVFLSVCCDDWESGGREKVEEGMKIRRV